MSVVSIPKLIEKLERELYETDDPRHDAWERGWRKGWNARATALVKELRGEATDPIDLRLRDALVGGGT